jgi:hypothetical protein
LCCSKCQITIRHTYTKQNICIINIYKANDRFKWGYKRKIIVCAPSIYRHVEATANSNRQWSLNEKITIMKALIYIH